MTSLYLVLVSVDGALDVNLLENRLEGLNQIEMRCEHHLWLDFLDQTMQII